MHDDAIEITIKTQPAILEFLRKEEPTRYTSLLHLRLKNPLRYFHHLEVIKEELMHNGSLTELTTYSDDDALRDAEIETQKNAFQDGIRYTNSMLSWEDSKKVSRVIARNNGKLVINVTNADVIRGKVVSQFSPHKQNINLADMYETTKEGMPIYFLHFFDKQSKKEGELSKIKNVRKDFWTYVFEGNDKRYILLSEKQIECSTYTIEGMHVNFDDDLLIGSKRRMRVHMPLFIVHTLHHARPKFKDHEELVGACVKAGINFNSLNNWLFSRGIQSYRHPAHFEALIDAYLLSSKIDGYPLHFFMVSKPGTGKSTMEEAIWTKMDEDVQIVEGSCSTLKSIIPSFKGNVPESGAILKSNRLCVIDEKLRILMRVDKDDRELSLASLNPILEHRKNRKVASGNGEIQFNPTAKVLAVSNPCWGTNTITSLCHHFDHSYLSRWLIWYQEEDHIKRIQNNEGIEMASFVLDPDLWLSVYDYCQAFTAKYDLKRIKEVYGQGLALLGEDTQDNTLREVREIYAARYLHHCVALLDGIVKTRCICTGDQSFVAGDVDYVALRCLIFRMMVEWEVITDRITAKTLITEFPKWDTAI